MPVTTVGTGSWQSVILALQHQRRCCGGLSALVSRRGTLQQPFAHAQKCQRTTSQGAKRHCAAAASASQQAASREQHNAAQVAAFDDACEELMQPLPREVELRLQRIADTPGGLDAASRVIDVGSGTGALIPFLQARGVRDILAVDLSPGMLRGLQGRFPPAGTLGNDPAVRTLCGDILDLPAYEGPVDAVFFRAVFTNVFEQQAALLAAAFLLKPGGAIVISHPLGRQWLAALHAASPAKVPLYLPDAAALEKLTHSLPLRTLSLVDEPEMYHAHLQVPRRYALPFLPEGAAPLAFGGGVVAGFGRGSRDLGFPTANLPPEELGKALRAAGLAAGSAPAGVYFGWAQLQDDGDRGAFTGGDFAPQPMVMNVGVRPTMEDSGGRTVELHIMHKYPQDFYGRNVRALVHGFIRPEIKFSGLPQLMDRIRTDIGIAKAQLSDPALSAANNAEWFA